MMKKGNIHRTANAVVCVEEVLPDLYHLYIVSHSAVYYTDLSYSIYVLSGLTSEPSCSSYRAGLSTLDQGGVLCVENVYRIAGNFRQG